MPKKLNFLPYFGGKFKNLNFLYDHFPPAGSYVTFVDVFGGSGVVTLNHPNRSKKVVEVYNDLNNNAVNLFRVLRDKEKAEELRRLLELTPWSRQEKYDCWETYADTELSDVERARQYVVVIGQGFFGKENSSWAVEVEDLKNQSRFINTLPQTIPYITARLREVNIENYSFEKIFKIYDRPGTFFYCDPPYVMESRRTGKCYEHEMDTQHHETFLQCCLSAQGRVLISGYPSELYENALAGWERAEKQVAAFSSNGKNKIDGSEVNKSTEVLWRNYKDESKLF
jgi:DNA adenine methylase